jgi:hypothetical protein
LQKRVRNVGRDINGSSNRAHRCFCNMKERGK